MQRMELKFKGLEVPALGSLRDITFRKFLNKQALLEAKRAEFDYLIAIATPNFSDNNDRRSWNSSVHKVFTEYVYMLHGAKPKLRSDAEEEMIKYYENVIRTSKMLLYKDESGGLVAEGFVKTGSPTSASTRKVSRKRPR